MAGGIFTNRPFEFNIKCIIFSTVLMVAYWFLPNDRNIFMLPLIFVISYVSLAWYDWAYLCQTKMYSGNKGFSLSSPFKPLRNDDPIKGTRDKYLVSITDQQRLYLKTVYLLHVFAIAPVMIYIGWYDSKSDKRVFDVIGGMGILAFIYHLFRFFNPRVIIMNNISHNV